MNKNKNKTKKNKKRVKRSKLNKPKTIKNVNQNVKTSSYSPTINKQLVTLKSVSRSPIYDCNNEQAFILKEPLKIGIPGYLFGKNCFLYNSPEAKQFLLKNLAANKHIDPNKIVPPVQSKSNCWFNSMFVTFFVSDKGRKFFHFFRQLMIEGKQKNGTKIPEKLQDAFALLNFGIDACLTGNKYAYELNTNAIIRQIYTSIPSNYKTKYPLIVDIDNAGNPVIYYMSMIDYLNNNDIQILFLRETGANWKQHITKITTSVNNLPHIIIMEIFDKDAGAFNQKPITFTVNNARYKLDSSVVRDTTKQHFCSTITCEKREYGYDGMSFSRLVPLEWKNKLNSKDFTWQFKGSNNSDGTPLSWNFTKCYQLLMYYRID
jgi:hypothetical protein